MAGIDSYVKVMLHFNGDDASTTITDEKGNTWTAVADAQLDTAQKKFGSASLLSDGVGDCITATDSSNFNLSDQNFTIDFWVRFASLGHTYQYFYMHCSNPWLNGIEMIMLDWGGATKVRFEYYINSAGQISFESAELDIATDTWYHFALVRNGSDLSFYKDGVSKGSQNIGSVSFPDYAHSPVIGASDYYYGDSHHYQPVYGWIDEFRLSVGIARWTENFTPPTEEYTAEPETYEGSIADGIGFAETEDYNFPYSSNDIAQALGLDDSAGGGISFTDELLEEIILTTESIWFMLYFDTAVDDVNFGDVSENIFIYISIAEDTINLADVITLSSHLDSLAAETLFIYDNPMPGWFLRIAEALVIVEAVLLKHGIPVAEWLILAENVTGGWQGSDTVRDMFVVTDDFVDALRTIALSIADALTTVDALALVWGLQVLDYLWLADVTPIKDMVAILDGTTFIDSTLWNWEGLIADVIAAVDTAPVQFLTAIGNVADAIGLADASSDYLELNFPIAEAITIADVVASKGNLFSVLLEALQFGVTISLSGEIWQCWVISNTEFDTSVFSNFNFNSYCNFQSKSYGVKADGLYILEGTTDQGTAIHAGVVFTTSNFGTENRKKFRRASLGVSGSNAAIRVQTDEGADRIFLVKDRRAYIDRDIIGKDYVFSISEFDTLDFVDLIPIIMAR